MTKREVIRFKPPKGNPKGKVPPPPPSGKEEEKYVVTIIYIINDGGNDGHRKHDK